MLSEAPPEGRPTAPRTPGALEALFERPMTAARWGLERVSALLDELGHPERAYASYHIAGTNGKGSVAAFAESALRAAGRATGLYTSPHLVDVRERFRVGGRPVEEGPLQAAAARVAASNAAAEATYFEVGTALAFLAFAEAGVTDAVIETGLGGRLDATNVLDPAAVAITSIGLDHVDLLGHTPAEVAREKAGIVKRGRPVALGEIDEEPRRVIEERALHLGAPVARLGVEAEVEAIEVDAHGTRFRYRSAARPAGLELETRLIGAHQARNAALALLMLETGGAGLEDEALRTGVAEARLPGRFELAERAGGRWILDIAHNEAGIACLLEAARAVGPPRPWIAAVGILADKPWPAMLDRLAAEMDGIVLTTPDGAPAPRRWSVGAARERLAERFAGRLEAEAGLGAALARANELRGAGTVFVTGSAYTVGEARSALGLE